MHIDKSDIQIYCRGVTSQAIYVYLVTTYGNEMLLMYVNLDPKEPTKYHLSMGNRTSGSGAYIEIVHKRENIGAPLSFEDMCEYVEAGPEYTNEHPIYKLTDFGKFKEDRNIKSLDEIENRIKEIYRNNGVLVFHQILICTNNSSKELNDDNYFTLFGILINLNTDKTITMEEIMG
jgi:hypothetical protein